MSWTSFGDFLAMGGYGIYVWGSFGTCLLLMAVEIMLVYRRRRQALSRLRSTKPQSTQNNLQFPPA